MGDEAKARTKLYDHVERKLGLIFAVEMSFNL
jgi:hypothetical protein